MDDHLLDEIFSRFDPEGTGKVRNCRADLRLLVHLREQTLSTYRGGTPRTLTNRPYTCKRVIPLPFTLVFVITTGVAASKSSRRR